jgi:hypothetical protein
MTCFCWYVRTATASTLDFNFFCSDLLSFVLLTIFFELQSTFLSCSHHNNLSFSLLFSLHVLINTLFFSHVSVLCSWQFCDRLEYIPTECFKNWNDLITWRWRSVNEGSRCGEIFFWWLKSVLMSAVGDCEYCCYAGSCDEKLRNMNVILWWILL